VRVNLGMRSLIDIIECDDRGIEEEVTDVTVDVDCDAADKHKDVGGVVVGELGLGLDFLSDDREGGGASNGTGGIA